MLAFETTVTFLQLHSLKEAEKDKQRLVLHLPLPAGSVASSLLSHTLLAFSFGLPGSLMAICLDPTLFRN